jgi:hypothetical protein
MRTEKLVSKLCFQIHNLYSYNEAPVNHHKTTAQRRGGGGGGKYVSPYGQNGKQ